MVFDHFEQLHGSLNHQVKCSIAPRAKRLGTYELANFSKIKFDKPSLNKPYLLTLQLQEKIHSRLMGIFDVPELERAQISDYINSFVSALSKRSRGWR